MDSIKALKKKNRSTAHRLSKGKKAAEAIVAAALDLVFPDKGTTTTATSSKSAASPATPTDRSNVVIKRSGRVVLSKRRKTTAKTQKK